MPRLPPRLPARWLLALVGMVVLAIVWGAAGSARAQAQSPAAVLEPWVAMLLGAVQGATEFLPVSSSGHLALAQSWLDVDPEAAGHRFNIVVHAGTLLAVLWLYRSDVKALAAAALRPYVASPQRGMLIAIAVATLPLGFALAPGIEPAVVTIEQTPRYVGIALLVTGVILLLAFRGSSPVPEEPVEEPPSWRRALGIGVAQLCAIVPGISRSGSTIAAGLGLGLDREQAARFSFLISIPAIGGASVREAKHILEQPGGSVDVLPLALGFVTSFAVGLVCLRWLLVLVRGGKIRGFVVYLAAIGITAIAIG